MKTLHKLIKPKKTLTDRFFVFDTETRGLRAKSDAFIFGVIVGEFYERVIFSVDEFINEFKKPMYKDKIVFAHNAEYDLNVIYDNIYSFDSKAVFNGKFICASNGNCLFADSANIYPAPLKTIGELLGMKKLITPKKFERGDKNIKVTKKDIEYCRRDCHIVFSALEKIFEKVGNVKVTLASLSLDFFRRNYLDFHIDYNENLIDYFFNSYFGGRTEAFKLGNVKAVVYDINSMYPYAMLNCIFPNPKFLKELKTMPDITMFKRFYLKNYEGVAEIEIEHKDCFFGFLPFKKDGKLLFPVGNFSGWWNFNEIRFALKHEIIEIKQIKSVIFSRKMKSPFIKFVDALYSERKKTDNELEKLQLKLLLNSLYGKFAQKKKTTFEYIENVKNDYEKIDYYKKSGELIKIHPFSKDRNDLFLELRNKQQENIYNSIPLFSSYITSFSRIMLLENLIKYQNFSPIYCDTDSIFFEKNPKILENNDLGGWKLEEKIVTNIRGLKNYSYFSGGKTFDKIKGVPKKARKVSENTFSYENLIKTREALARNIDAGVLTTRTKVLTNRYDKRIILKNGQDTIPIKIN